MNENRQNYQNLLNSYADHFFYEKEEFTVKMNWQ